eukprot:Nitzschia sp. Nitz4//scaffold82_size85912//35740//36993//NITZ4_005139-RA/size85912-processed-gene-0.30-mRNA-1//-1//CDS//3329558829//92//frame0
MRFPYTATSHVVTTICTSFVLGYLLSQVQAFPLHAIFVPCHFSTPTHNQPATCLQVRFPNRDSGSLTYPSPPGGYKFAPSEVLDRFLNVNIKETPPELLKQLHNSANQESYIASGLRRKVPPGPATHYTTANSKVLEDEPSLEDLARNPYIHIFSQLKPAQWIDRFRSCTPPRVHEAVRTTLLNMQGSFPSMEYTTSVMVQGKKLANLMFQLQMTGYMFQNAEHRLSMLDTELMGRNYSVDDLLVAERRENMTTVGGTIQVKFPAPNGTTPMLPPVSVDINSFVSDLKHEVQFLRSELLKRRRVDEDYASKDLLQYIRSLNSQELKSLTGGMSDDVLVCMRGIVHGVLRDVEKNNWTSDKLSPDEDTELPSGAMIQLCMWQLVVGYALRQMEERDALYGNMQESEVHAVLQDGAIWG